MSVKPIPDDYPGATPYLCCKDAADTLEFYKAAFGAVETMRMPTQDGKIAHAEFKISGATIMISDEFPKWDVLSPRSIGGTASSTLIYVENVDAFAEKAIAKGAKVLLPVSDQFWGDRSVKFEDPSGHRWMFASRIENLTPKEMAERGAALFNES
ncbi:MAG TPA: VOC family protein [Chthoniobacterales bacterium]